MNLSCFQEFVNWIADQSGVERSALSFEKLKGIYDPLHAIVRCIICIKCKILPYRHVKQVKDLSKTIAPDYFLCCVHAADLDEQFRSHELYAVHMFRIAHLCC